MCTTEIGMLQHINNTHTVNESFVYPESTEEAFFVDHKFALHMYTELYNQSYIWKSTQLSNPVQQYRCQ